MCVTEFGVLHAGIQLILTCPMRRAQSPFLPVPRQEVKVLPGSGPTEPCTHKHTQRHDGHRRQAQLPSLLLNSRTPIIKCPSSPIKTNSLDCALLLSIGLTDTNDCVIHPPQPHPLLTAPVSHTALAQSGEIVSCLFLNTHLYLTAYWVSISPNVHYVWMCSWACVRVCVCQLFQWVYVSSATCLSCSPLFPILKVCLSIKQQGWWKGVGAWQRGGW